MRKAASAVITSGLDHAGGSNVFSGIVNGTSSASQIPLYTALRHGHSGEQCRHRKCRQRSRHRHAALESGLGSSRQPGRANVLNWSSVSGLTYRVWSTTNLALPFTAYSGMVTATVPTSLSPITHNSVRYFRVQLIPDKSHEYAVDSSFEPDHYFINQPSNL